MNSTDVLQGTTFQRECATAQTLVKDDRTCLRTRRYPQPQRALSRRHLSGRMYFTSLQALAAAEFEDLANMLSIDFVFQGFRGDSGRC